MDASPPSEAMKRSVEFILCRPGSASVREAVFYAKTIYILNVKEVYRKHVDICKT